MAGLLAEIVVTEGAACERCGALTAREFSGDKFSAYPVAMTRELAMSELRHPDCGARISLAEPLVLPITPENRSALWTIATIGGLP